MKLKILARDVRLEESHTLFVDYEAYGLYMDNQNKIVVDSHVVGIMKADVLLHESLHVIQEQIRCFGDIDEDEEHKIIIPLTTALLQLLRDNKEYLMETIFFD
jgi:hypothetical protein